MPGIDDGMVFPGGDSLDKKALSGGLVEANLRKGVFARQPAMTPKYHTGNTDASLGYMARLMIPLSQGAYKTFIESIPEGPARSIAQTMALEPNASGPVAASRNTVSYGYIDFLLQQVTEQYQEKYEAVDVLSDNYVSYFYGQQPPVFQYSGTLLNTYQDDWRSAFTILYQEIMRGTKMARRKVVANLAYDDVIVTGVMINMSQTMTADMEMAVPFTFQMLVKRYDTYARSGGPLCKPTAVEQYGLRKGPSNFTSQLVTPTAVSTYNASAPLFTVVPRKNSDAAKPPADKVTYDGNVTTAVEDMYNQRYDPTNQTEGHTKLPGAYEMSLAPNKPQEVTEDMFNKESQDNILKFTPMDQNQGVGQ